MLITEWIERFNPCFSYFFYKRAEIIIPSDSVKMILYNHQISSADKKWLIDKTLNTVGHTVAWQINTRAWRITSYNKNRQPFSSVISTEDLARFMEEVIDYIGERDEY